MMRKSLWGVGLAAGVSVLALGACEPSALDQTEVSEKASPARTACIDPATGKLIPPGPDVKCSVPAQATTDEEPIVRDLEGGGKAIDLKGQGHKNQVEPASQNRMAVVDRKTGELLTSRPGDALAAARYDRSVARARSIMKRQQAARSDTLSVNQILVPEALPSGGIKIDLQGRFQVPLVAKLSKDGQVHLRHQHQH